jgi:nitrogen PTS system EIIA component
MQLSKLLKSELVYFDEFSKGKTSLFSNLCKLLSTRCESLCEKELFDAFITRERLGNTAIGHGIALPHIRSDKITQMLCCLIKLKNEIDFGAEDQKPVNIVIALIVPHQHINEHLKTLSQIASYFNDENVRENIKKANDYKQLQQAIFCNELAISA